MRKLSVPLYILCALFVCVFAAFSITENKKIPTFEDILNLESPGTPIISPDGSKILYTVRKPDWKANTYKSQIWITDTLGNENRQITFHEKSSSSPDWSPDGKYISFISARENGSQIYVMSSSGGEAKKLTASPTGVRGWEWSPDGRYIAYTATDEQSQDEKDLEEKLGKFEIVDENLKMRRLFIIEVETGEADKIIDRNDLNISSFSWSPDGKAIAFSATPDPRAESWSKSDIYILNIDDKSIRTLVALEGSDSSPLWSPDGKFISFSSKLGKKLSFMNTYICMIPASGGEIINLTENFDENASAVTWNENGIYFTAYKGMSRHLFSLNPQNKKITQISQGENLILRGSTISRGSMLWAFSLLDATHYPEIYVSDIKTYSPTKLTNFSAQIQDWTLGRKEIVSWKSTDGNEITGVLMKPADFDANKKYPLFVIIHGGPTSISYPQFVDSRNSTYPIEQWLAKGAVILQPNYRGSAGFGEDFRKLNFRNLGVGDYWDVISGVDYLIDQGFVDPERLGAMGWSQGGYISAFITTYSDRFKAVSVGAGISDWVTYYYLTDIHPFTRMYLGATPWDDEEVYRKTSPMTYINNAQTPTLIQHGEFDQRVPIPNAYKLYQGLQDKGVPVKFIVYKGFGHGVTKPKEKLAVLTHNYEWFNQYIWGEN